MVSGRKRVAAGGAGGHGEAAGGRPQPTGRPRGGEDPLDLHGRGRYIIHYTYMIIPNPVLGPVDS